jgi:hypothetical protein
MKGFGLAACLLAAGLFAGCFQHTIRVAVHADGSGSISVRQVLSNETLAVLEQQAGKRPVFNEAQIKEFAAQYGPNVHAIVVREISLPKGQGYLAIYEFSDINQVRIPTGKEPYSFVYRKGYLTAKSPRPPSTRQKVESPSRASTDGFAQLIKTLGAPYGFSGKELPEVVARRVLSDLEISIDLDLPEGTETSHARHVEPQNKSRVRLLQVDGQVMSSRPAAIQTLLQADGQAPIEVLLSGLPGVKIEPKAELKFKLP